MVVERTIKVGLNDQATKYIEGEFTALTSSERSDM